MTTDRGQLAHGLPKAKRPLSEPHKELLKLIAEKLVEDFLKEQETDTDRHPQVVHE